VVACVLVAIRPSGAYLHTHVFFGAPPQAPTAAVGGSYVARVAVNGIITDDAKLQDAVRRVATDADAAGLIVAIDSPGGSVAGGEALHDAIAAVAAVKPVVAVMGGTAASAGYMIAVPATRIFARQSTLTGSIGVFLQTGDVSGLLKMLGIAADPIVSGPLKDQPSFVKPLSPEGRDVLQGLVMDLIGGEPDARAWLAATKGVSADLPTQDVQTDTLVHRTFGGLFGSFGGGLWKSLFSQGVMLDGAMALWQPGLK
jgi:protease-4